MKGVRQSSVSDPVEPPEVSQSGFVVLASRGPLGEVHFGWKRLLAKTITLWHSPACKQREVARLAKASAWVLSRRGTCPTFELFDHLKGRMEIGDEVITPTSYSPRSWFTM